jgi:tRNA-2-methylthio-N6-dimethylallyladenosine synthase
MPGQVDEAVKTERLLRLQTLLEAQQRAFNADQIGRRAPVLFERPGRHPGQIIGRSPYLQAVHCTGDEALIGTIASVDIVGAAHNSLTGRLMLETA